MLLCKERKQATFPFHGEVFSVSCNLNVVHGLASQSIRRAENLNGTDQIQFFDEEKAE